MKKFLVYLLVIVCVVSMGFAIFYLVRDNEVISVTHASMYVDKNQTFDIELKHKNKKRSTEINVTSSSQDIVKILGGGSYLAVSGGVARVNFRTSNVRYRNLWCDVIVGDGSAENPFYISSAEQLANIGKSEEYGLDKSYKLVNDIDMSEVNNGLVEPAGDFTGVFDGNGYTISGVVIDRDTYSETQVDTQNQVNASASARTTFENAGFFSRVMPGAKVYNVNFDNVIINGEYKTAGVIAGVNYGTIERVKVTNAIFNLIGDASNFFGGIAGINESSEETIDGTLTRSIARIDRCSVSGIWGKEYNHEQQLVNAGITGTIGGLVGKNLGGIVIYSFAEGEAVFGNSDIIYGGLVGVNQYIELTPTLFDENNQPTDAFVGANVKDSYAYIRTNMLNTNLSQNVYGGVIGKVYDYYVKATIKEQNGGSKEQSITTNKIVGLYYENTLLNDNQDGEVEKNLKGIGKYLSDAKGSTSEEFSNFADCKYVVEGKVNNDIKFNDNYNNQFLSHKKVEYKFDENGNYIDTIESEITWPFEQNVWNVIDESEEKNFPILNYGMVDVADGFDEIGNPTIQTQGNQTYIGFVHSQYTPNVTVNAYDLKLVLVEKPTAQLVATPTNLKFTWSTSDNSVVSVSENGLVTAKGIGVATITATLQSDESKGIVGGAQATCVVTVVAPEFTLSPSEKTLSLGDSFVVKPSNENIKPEFASSNTSYAVVDSEGKVTAVGLPKGQNSVKVTITADYKGSTASCVVTIVGEELALDKTEVTISVGQSITLKEVNGTDVEWKSLNSAVATVTSAGVVKGIKVGITYVTATSASGDVVTCKVIVKSSEIQLSTNSISINVNEERSVEVTNASQVGAITWSSENTNIATVDNNGKIKGVSQGITRVVATSEAGNVAYVVVKVNTTADVQYSLTFTESVYTINVGGKATIKYDANPSNATINWSSDNTSVATVSNGVVTGVKGGSVVITANMVVNGNTVASAKALVYVIEITEDEEFITFNNTNVILTTIGQTYTLTFTTNVDKSQIVFTSSNNSVATVDANGKITAKGYGTATITASYNGKVLASCSVTIAQPSAPEDNYTYKVDIKKPFFNMNMEMGGSRYVYATTYGTDAGANITEENIVWTSSNENVVRVSNGNNPIVDNLLTYRVQRTTVTAVGTGSATITATIMKDGKVKATSTRTVTVVKAFDNYISSVEELDAMRRMEYSCYYLVADLDLSGYDWQPIGTITNPFTRNFTAKFNGRRYVINNLTVNATSNDNVYGGLFGYLGLCADIRYVTLNNTTVTGFHYAGAVAGYNNGSIRYARINNVTISSINAAGGIAGINDSRIFNCTVSGGNITLNATSSVCGVGGVSGINKGVVLTVNVLGMLNICGNTSANLSVNVGGIVGNNTGSVTDAVVNTTGNINLQGNISGNIGGITGSCQGSILDSYFSGNITASTTNPNVNVGGIVGYFIGSALDVVRECGVIAANIVGYAAGGIAGVISSTQKYELITTKYGLGQIVGTYIANFAECAVDATVKVTGAVAGGIASLINSGVVVDSYAQAKVSGVNSSSIVAGLVGEIQSHLNSLGYGTAGLMKQCYSACTFIGSGVKHAITSSDIHVEGGSRGSAGYIMNYLWDSSIANGAAAPNNNWRKYADYVAKATTAALQKIATYIAQGFSEITWSLRAGAYVKLADIDFTVIARILSDN